ncbi:MAG: cation diffusion facilitator family transporter [Armatimonadota bacterium]
MVDVNQKASVAMLSIISNTSLVILKLIIGIFIGSVSVISEAIHSGVDLLAAIIAFFAVKTSGRAADEDHPFGHGKAENISGTVEALLIFVAALWIIYEAIHKLMKPTHIEAAGWGVGIMLLSAVLNLIVSSRLFKVGRATDSVALQADAWHLRTDVYTSAGVMGGLAIYLIGSKIFPGADIRWIDPVAAIAVALLIIKAAYGLTVESARDLMDVSLPVEEEQWIREYMTGKAGIISGFHHLRTRKAGSNRFVDVHITVDANMSVEESHAICEEITERITEHFPGSSVHVHVEPCNFTCTDNCISGCLMGEEYRDLKYQNGKKQ